ncbi:MAG: formylglycine-generating enzyme family protein [Planctomycetota bacterium]|nr:formylglycine-generating enzyme family protein [Planctomycetota bacterium]
MTSPLLWIPGIAILCAHATLAQSTGSTFCTTSSNSTGFATTLSGSFGSGNGSDLHLEVSQGVPGEIAYVLVGNEATPGVIVGGNQFCLLGTATARFYRYNQAGTSSNSVGIFDASGVLQNISGTSTVGSGFDVPSTVPGGTPIAITAGSTWHFQAWHRDTPVGPGASNFSNGLSVSFTFHPTPIPGMSFIPAGTFQMGSDTQQYVPPYFAGSEASPVHDVTHSQAFWMGQREVTQFEYQTIMGVNPSFFLGSDHPVENVSWLEASAYCEILTANEIAAGNLPAGFEYRLPTEAEWEYACRAGSTTEFYTGPDLFCTDAHIQYSAHAVGSCLIDSTTPVASFPSNGFGLYDMHGNVSEWCLDNFEPYGPDALTDPFVSGGNYKVHRGGGWFSASIDSRSAFRHANGPWGTSWNVGFRVVLGRVLTP